MFGIVQNTGMLASLLSSECKKRAWLIDLIRDKIIRSLLKDRDAVTVVFASSRCLQNGLTWTHTTRNRSSTSADASSPYMALYWEQIWRLHRPIQHKLIDH